MSLRHDSPKDTLCKRQSPHHPKITSAGQLVCPHCQTAFPVIWRQYWADPWGNYRALLNHTWIQQRRRSFSYRSSLSLTGSSSLYSIVKDSRSPKFLDG